MAAVDAAAVVDPVGTGVGEDAAGLFNEAFSEVQPRFTRLRAHKAAIDCQVGMVIGNVTKLARVCI